MPGGVLQLAAFGNQNLFLTGNPQITFFVSVYKRHTNFAIESIRVYLLGHPDFGKRCSCILDRYGDLVTEMFLEVNLPRISYPTNERNNIYYSWTNSVGHAILNYVELEIGGEVIDRHYGQWLEIWNELTIPAEKRLAYNEMIGKHENFNATAQGGAMKLRIPLNFWFNRNKGLALPLIALQYHEVRLNFEFRKLDELWTSSTKKIVNSGDDCINIWNVPIDLDQDAGCNCGKGCDFDCSVAEQEKLNLETLHMGETLLYVDYIFLDTDERRRYVECKHEYLIDQIQIFSESLNTNITTNKVHLNFNHPVKELIWVFQTSDVLQQRKHTGMELFNFNAGVSMNPIASDDCGYFAWKQNGKYGGCVPKDKHKCIPCIEGREDNCELWPCESNTGNGIPRLKPEEPMEEAKIQFEGNDRFCEREGKYFRLVQPYQRHTRVPDNFIYLYSFGFSPEEHQPSGAANFSMIDNVTLHVKMRKNINNSIIINVYAFNYNILKIQYGMAGTVYNN